MNAREHRNVDGELLTVSQTAENANLGASTVRKIAEQAGAVRKIGRLYRIDRAIFFDFIAKQYSC